MYPYLLVLPQLILQAILLIGLWVFRNRIHRGPWLLITFAAGCMVLRRGTALIQLVRIDELPEGGVAVLTVADNVALPTLISLCLCTGMLWHLMFLRPVRE